MKTQSENYDFSSFEFMLLCQDRLHQIDSETDELFFKTSLTQSPSSQQILTKSKQDTIPEDCRNNDESTANSAQTEDSEPESGLDSRVVELVQYVNECAAKRSKIRLDEISKAVVRKLFRLQKHQFINSVTSSYNGEIPNADQMQALLIHYLAENFDLKRESLLEGDELVVAKSIFYNFSARRQDDTLGHTNIEKMRRTRVKFCDRGTKKEAINFFSSDVALKVIYPGYRDTLLYLSASRSDGPLKAVRRTLSKLVKKLNASVFNKSYQN